jgi:hypothetical protein
MTIWPVMPSLTQNAHLHIRAIGYGRVVGSTHIQNPPSPGSVVTFSGDLLTVQNSVAVLAVDEMTYLPTAAVQPNDMEAID